MQQSGLQEGQAGVRDATAQPRLRGAASLECVDQPEREVVAVFGAAVGQSCLGQVPDLLVGIEFGAVGREILEPEPWNPTTQLVNRRQAMQAQAIPEHDHRTPEMAQQVRKERADLGLADVVMVPLVVEAEVLTNGADRETGNHRDPIAAIPMAHEWRLAARRPGAQHGGREHETGLVYKDDVGPQPNGVFFTRGQALRFQRVIACSSRSRARRSGFWQLQPH